MAKVRHWSSDADRLPGIALAGLAMAVVALIIASVAFIRIGIVAGQKADRADARSQSAARTASLAVCALANAQRIGNRDAPRPSPGRGVYVATAWQITYESLGCTMFSKAELDAVVKTPTPTTPTSPVRTPSPQRPPDPSPTG